MFYVCVIHSIRFRFFFFFSSRRRHTRWPRDWSSDVCSSDLVQEENGESYFVNEDVRFPVENMEIKEGLALIRPEMIQLSKDGPIEGIVQNSVYHGSSMRYEVKVGSKVLLVDDYNVFNKNLYTKGQSINLNIPKQVHLIST